ncbi:MAG: hypothetical protein IPG43_04250 [Proteobacteria bacterium]|nr:hypothetical protein [Pseudomonadota bacterium]
MADVAASADAAQIVIHSIAIEAAAARRNEVKGMGEIRKSSGKSAAKGRRDQWRADE